MQVGSFEQRLAEARTLDAGDDLSRFRDEFHIPKQANGEPVLYFVGNSLGLQPKRTEDYVAEELHKWRDLGVRGHFECERPWMPYHELLTDAMAELVGAQNNEVVMMNSLTVNLHLMMASFYRPNGNRHKILIEPGAFPSDYQAAWSQIRWHGGKPEESLLVIPSEARGQALDEDLIIDTILEHGETLALVLLPGVQYYTGQVFPMERIAEAAHRVGARIGLDLAHAAGNIRLKLHEWNVDFAVWCSYKYLNSGPGSVGGCFVHERHATDVNMLRLAGWWGHDKGTRFKMKNEFNAIPTAEGWQLSNPPILSKAAIRASLSVFEEVGGMSHLIGKSTLLTEYLNVQLKKRIGNRVRVITPESARGCQLSLEVDCGVLGGQEIHRRLDASNVETDWRDPNVIRVAPVPLYNSFEDCFHFVERLAACMDIKEGCD